MFSDAFFMAFVTDNTEVEFKKGEGAVSLSALDKDNLPMAA